MLRRYPAEENLKGLTCCALTPDLPTMSKVPEPVEGYVGWPVWAEANGASKKDKRSVSIVANVQDEQRPGIGLKRWD